MSVEEMYAVQEETAVEAMVVSALRPCRMSTMTIMGMEE